MGQLVLQPYVKGLYHVYIAYKFALCVQLRTGQEQKSTLVKRNL